MTRDETGAVLVVLCAEYPVELSDQLVDNWADTMADLAYEDVAAAVNAHMRESTFFPRISEIRTRVLGPAAALPKPMTSADEQVRATYRRSMLSTIETLGWDRTVEMHGEDRVREAVGARRYNELAAGAEVGLAAMLDAAERDASAAVEGGEA